MRFKKIIDILNDIHKNVIIIKNMYMEEIDNIYMIQIYNEIFTYIYKNLFILKKIYCVDDIRKILSLVNHLNLSIRFIFIIYFKEYIPENNMDVEINIINDRIHFEKYRMYMSFDPNENYNIQQEIKNTSLLDNNFIYKKLLLCTDLFISDDKCKILNFIKYNIDKLEVLILKQIIIVKNNCNKLNNSNKINLINECYKTKTQIQSQSVTSQYNTYKNKNKTIIDNCILVIFFILMFFITKNKKKIFNI